MPRCLVSILAVAAVATIAPEARAHGRFVTTEGKPIFWRARSAVLNLQLGTFNATAAAAAQDWNSAGSAFRFLLQPAPFVADPCNHADGINTIAFANPCGFAGGTHPEAGFSNVYIRYFPRSGEIVEADVTLDPDVLWQVFDGASPRQRNVFPFAPEYDLRRTVLYQLGHVLGLADPVRFGQFVDAVMNGPVGGVSHLTMDDVRGARAIYPVGTASPTCAASATSVCLQSGRFRVEVAWQDYVGNGGPAGVVPFGTADSGLFYFYGASNWEILVKVLDGCHQNGRFWVFAASATTLEYALTVTDTQTGIVREYYNPLGRSAPAITDVEAFATCSGGGTAARALLDPPGSLLD